MNAVISGSENFEETVGSTKKKTDGPGELWIVKIIIIVIIVRTLYYILYISINTAMTDNQLWMHKLQIVESYE